jgi:hypothetical protein
MFGFAVNDTRAESSEQVGLEDGSVCDRYSISNDCIHLSSSSGVYLHEDLLAILAVGKRCIHRGNSAHLHSQISPYVHVLRSHVCVQIHSQAVHLLQLLPSGRMVKVQQFGKYCWDDDELILSEQADAEERWRSSQVQGFNALLAMLDALTKCQCMPADGEGSVMAVQMKNLPSHFFRLFRLQICPACATSCLRAVPDHHRHCQDRMCQLRGEVRLPPFYIYIMCLHRPWLDGVLCSGMCSRGVSCCKAMTR